jgi:hypothetical protein
MAAEKLQPSGHRALAEVLLAEWVSGQLAAITMRRDLLEESQLQEVGRAGSAWRAIARTGSPGFYA